ncbi:hypothetical protein EGM97_01795 [Pseudomonas sp. AF32]|nr:hypothetical protein [Pseudomonas sp. AF32]
MTFEICAFDKSTEDFRFSITVPSEHVKELRKIMKWTKPEDELFGYDLNEEQIAQLEKMLDTRFYIPECDFQISG